MDSDLFSSFSFDGGMESMAMGSAPAAGSEEFVYDAAGNRVTVYHKDGVISTFTHNPLDQYTIIGKDYGWGLIIDEYLYYDTNGNLQLDGIGIGYEYDGHSGKLTEVKSGGLTLASYEYDSLGRRIKTVNGSQTLYHYYDPSGRLFAQSSSSTAGIALDRVFIYGQTREPLAMFLPEPYSYIDSNDMTWLADFSAGWLCDTNSPAYMASLDMDSSGFINMKDFAAHINTYGWHTVLPTMQETQFYYLHDAIGSTVALVGGRYGRDTDGESYNYDVYGQPDIISGLGNPFLFGSMRADVIEGSVLYHDQSRTYSPVLGRYLQPSMDEAINAFEFAGSNPIMKK